ncbi:MAG: cation:proton antiporter [Phaeodactylibacter sp.]|nr:cation:proton antiporter [Phaeodactylibacter sp.]MCB9293890.1 cation:proton antiporter [Lewinellaceae bacterium]
MGPFDHLLREFELPLENPVLVFSLMLFIILLAPILLRKARIPGIIGLILSGVVIGPNGLGFLEKNAAIGLFSTVGLLYIMFIAGIELDLFEFKKNRHQSIGFGFFTFFFPLALGFPVCYYLLGYGTAASFLTASMFSTHTLVAYPIVAKFGVSKDRAVAATVGGTILTDTAVLFILAVVVGSSEGGLSPAFWARLLLSLAVFSFIVFWAVPWVARWFFVHLEGDQASLFVLVLSLVFFSAFLAELAGVEAIIGAFMAGLALNRFIPHSSALMNRLEFVGHAIFIPFFLISVGMLVDVGILLEGKTAIIVALVLSSAALAGKWIAALAAQLAFKFSRNQRQLIFGLSSSHAAATLAVILVGFDAGIIDEHILNGTIILILITCLAASFVTENAAMRLVREQESEAFPEAGPWVQEENILVPIAKFDNLEPLLDLAILLKTYQAPFAIHVLSVVKYDGNAEANMLKARRKLAPFVSHAAETETRLNPIVTFDLNAADGIIRISREIMASLIVMGWPRKETFIDKIFGQTTETIINSTDKAVFLCNIRKPLNTVQTIRLMCPPSAELEPGFHHWLDKVMLLARELSAGVKVYSDEAAFAAIASCFRKTGAGLSFTFSELPDWASFSSVEIKREDFLIVVSAREGAVSFSNVLRGVPAQMGRHAAKIICMLIFPSVRANVSPFDEYRNANSGLVAEAPDIPKDIG